MKVILKCYKEDGRVLPECSNVLIFADCVRFSVCGGKVSGLSCLRNTKQCGNVYSLNY